MIYIDTSAFYAIFDADDANHPQAAQTWAALIQTRETLVCNNYVLVETYALVQHRFGMKAVVDLEKIMPLLQMEWITPEYHRSAISLLISARRRDLSLVDCSSFESMRRLGIEKAFAFDDHFRQQGFELIS
jgi:predicted nucleic acid-binding protein